MDFDRISISLKLFKHTYLICVKRLDRFSATLLPKTDTLFCSYDNQRSVVDCSLSRIDGILDWHDIFATKAKLPRVFSQRKFCYTRDFFTSFAIMKNPRGRDFTRKVKWKWKSPGVGWSTKNLNHTLSHNRYYDYLNTLSLIVNCNIL